MTLFTQVLEAYAARRCFACEQMGPCAHREFDVEVAYLERQPRKPVKREVMDNRGLRAVKSRTTKAVNS